MLAPHLLHDCVLKICQQTALVLRDDALMRADCDANIRQLVFVGGGRDSRRCASYTLAVF